MGLDNAIISVGPGRVMVVTADPLSIIPSLGMVDSAWLTVHELASDLTTSAVAPQFAVLDYNLPPSLSPEDFERYAVAVSEECKRLGISIVGGHTGRYPGSGFSIVGGGMMMAISGDDEYVTPRMIGEGDDIIMTKGAAIEATAVLSLAFPERTEEKVGGKVTRRAASYLRRCSTVEDALAASSVGVRSEGVTAMHDATEGGVMGGLYELARTSGRTLRVEKERIYVSAESKAVCAAYGPGPSRDGERGDSAHSLPAEPLGRRAPAPRRQEDRRVQDRDGRQRGYLGSAWLRRGRAGAYIPPKFDPYWAVYARGVKRGWK